MQKGMSLIELAQEIERVEAAKEDYVVPTSKMEMADSGQLTMAEGEDKDKLLGINNLAHEQIAERLKIPAPYYKRMLADEPALLAKNVNTWLHKKPERRLVRVLDGRVRAFLSDRFSPRENYSIAMEVLPVLKNTGGLEIQAASITERRMYVKVTSKDLVAPITVTRNGQQVGDVLYGGINVSNSEVGVGAADISLFIVVLSCTNGMTREHSLREIHVGRRLEGEAEQISFYSRETIEADQIAFRMKVRDSLKHAFNKELFLEEVTRYQEVAGRHFIASKVPDIVERVTKRFTNLGKNDGKSLMDALYGVGDFSQWGLSQAITSLANGVEDFDRINELERLGGQIIDLKPDEFSTLAA